MFIEVGKSAHELSTKLGTAMALEKKFHMPVTQIFEKIQSAEIPELLDMLSIAVKKEGAEEQDFRQELIDNWDYLDLQLAVQEMLVKLMFSGTPEQIETKLAKYPATEQQKNAMREFLGIPIPEAPEDSTGKI